MNENKLIMPKQTGKKDVFYASLSLYYNAWKNHKEWYDNTDFKQEIQRILPRLSQGAQDSAYLVKQSELTRYFWLVEYDYEPQIGRGRITKEGIDFFNAYLRHDDSTQIDIIMHSIFNKKFGRHNTAIKASDSDVDPPKLFIKAMYDLGEISRKDLAYLLYATHDKKISYEDALIEFKSSVKDREINIPEAVSNKYSDVKFTVLLTELGICVDTDGKYSLSSDIKTKYHDKIESMSIYNRQPEIILTLDEDAANDIDATDNENEQQKIITSFAYDIDSTKFKQQNNRKPIPITSRNGQVVSYKRNVRISKTALHLANFECQLDKNHQTFISKLGLPYMEAHHLIPMCAQKNFEANLDRVENIVCICPTCHSAIHLGNDATRVELLHQLYNQKIDKLREAGIDIKFGELFSRYYG